MIGHKIWFVKSNYQRKVVILSEAKDLLLGEKQIFRLHLRMTRAAGTPHRR
jgi:hypothetical protein